MHECAREKERTSEVEYEPEGEGEEEESEGEGEKSRAQQPCGSCAPFQLCREVFKAPRLNLAQE